MTAKWKLMYELAKQYYQEHGDLLVPARYICEDGTKLGRWIQNQRKAYKNRTISKEERKNNYVPLTDEQVKLLEVIGMEWDLKKEPQKRWMRNYEKAKEYYHQHGHLRIPQTYCTKDGASLGTWIYNQRVAYKNRTLPKEEQNNNLSPLTDEQVKLLEVIGMKWNSKKGWMENYEKAKEYYQKHGNLLVPVSYICEDETKLGGWIHHQRIAYKNRIIPKEERKNTISPLTDEQIKLLENIGMVWDIWEYKRKQVCEYKRKQEWIKSLEFVENEIVIKSFTSKTNKWLTEQFQLQEQNKLTKNQLTMLKNTGVYSTPTYQIYFRQAFLEVFKKVIYYFRDHRALLDPTDITRLGWNYETWYDIFNKNELGILDHKQYEVWRKVWFISKQRNKVFKIK